MNVTVAEHMTPKPWYKQFYPWMLIAIPFLTVIGCIVTITIAVTSPNALVKENYYKDGLAINQDKRRLKQAQLLNLDGLLRGGDQRVTMTLQGDLEIWPDTLELQFAHATRAEMDRQVTLHVVGPGLYENDWTQLPDGHWYFHLLPESKEWELQGRIKAEGVFQVKLAKQN